MKYAAGCTAKRIPASYAAAVRAGCISSDRGNFLYRGHRCSPGAFGRTGGGRCDCGAFRSGKRDGKERADRTQPAAGCIHSKKV